MARNIIAIVSIILLIAAILFGLSFYQRSLRKSRTISEMEKKVAQLNLEKKAIKGEQDTLHQEVLKKSQELQTADRLAADLRKTIQSKDLELKSSKERINELEKSETDLNKRLAAKEDALKGFKHQLGREHAATGALRGQVDQLQQAIQAKQSKLEEEQNEIVRLKETLAGLKARQIPVGPPAANSEKQLESQSKLASCLTRIEAVQKSEKQLQQEISQLRERKNLVESELAQLHATSNKLISRLQENIQRQEIVISQYKEKLSVRVLDRILFESGRAKITAEGKAVLRKVGEVLRETNGKTVQVIGNTDNVPIALGYRYRYASNWELSAARAAAVVRFFQHECGIDPGDMEAIGRSFYHPVASNSTEEGRAENRNVEILIRPKLNNGRITGF